MAKFSVLVRFCNEARKEDFEKRFDCLDDALAYFRFIVSLSFDGLLSSFWFVSLSRGKSVLQSFTNHLSYV